MHTPCSYILISIFTDQVSLPCIRQLLTKLVYSLLLSENLFPVNMAKTHRTNTMQLPSCIPHQHPAYHLSNKTYLPILLVTSNVCYVGCHHCSLHL